MALFKYKGLGTDDGVATGDDFCVDVIEVNGEPARHFSNRWLGTGDRATSTSLHAVCTLFSCPCTTYILHCVDVHRYFHGPSVLLWSQALT